MGSTEKNTALPKDLKITETRRLVLCFFLVVSCLETFQMKQIPHLIFSPAVACWSRLCCAEMALLSMQCSPLASVVFAAVFLCG